MVVGGGPGGMKAAVIAAQRGHQVTLYEGSGQLGGQVLLAQLLPGRMEFGGVVTNLKRELDLHQVKVVRNTVVEIRFSDDGVGIAPENLKRIFDPFFTTKLGQGGSGLGMSISYNIVTSLFGGELDVESTPGHGCRFTLRLPLVSPYHPEDNRHLMLKS